MSYKVIVADDSQTIQKVINITLAKQPYQLIECLSEEALFSELEKTKADLVCLDFNLSDNFSGPELAERIRTKSPSTQVLFLMGTFDTIDDATMEKCGAADKIVKPFDSNKFISLCKRLTHQEPGVANPPKDTSTFDDLDSEWTVNDTVEKIPSPIRKEEISTLDSELNALDKEMSEWGMSVPGVIDQSPTGPMVDIPPVIELPQEEPEVIEQDTGSFPSAADLEYPDIKPNKSTSESSSSKLISLDNFNEFPDKIELEGSYIPEETSNVDELEELIKDEVEEDLWKVDEFEDLKGEVEKSLIKEAQSMTQQMFESDEEVFPRLDKDDVLPNLKFTETPVASVSKEEVEELVQKYVKQYLDELFASKIEKIAWEMIPDLAENLIRSELKKISSKVLEDQD